METTQQRMLQEYLADTSSRGIVLSSPDGSIVFVNTRFFDLLGGSDTGETQGTEFNDFLVRLPERGKWQGPRTALFLPQISPFLARSVHRVDLFFESNHWLQFSGRPMTSGGYVLTLTDVTSFHMAMNNIRQINRNTTKSLADIAENRDHDTGEHVLKVARLTHEIAWDLHEHGLFQKQLDDDFLSQIGMASILHDVGKVSVPDAVLLKPGRLTPEEMEIMRGHAQSGFRIIHKIQDLQADAGYFEIAAAIALSHHEKFAGGGYPHGIKGTDIPLEARIVAVSDVFDALTSWRPYKEPWHEEKALAFIDENAGLMFDPLVVQALHRVLHRRKVKSLVHWDATMSVGEGTMDKDHRVLIDLINQLALARERQDIIIMDFIMDELYNYTIRHFEREEEHMRAGGFPLLDQHQRIHQAFARQVAEVRLQFLNNPAQEISTELMEMLGSWLQKHIQGVDQEYHRFFTCLGPSEIDGA